VESIAADSTDHRILSLRRLANRSLRPWVSYEYICKDTHVALGDVALRHDSR
jgi:hypothetical protein